MKPKTKKTLVVMAAVAVVATIIWMVVRTKVSAKAIVNSLDVDKKTRKAIKGHLSEVTDEEIDRWVSSWSVSKPKAKALEALSIALEAGEIESVPVYNRLASQIMDM